MIDWISIKDQLPEQGQKVVCGHRLGEWVEHDVLFFDGQFRLREHSPRISGILPYKNNETKKDDGITPAPPSDWLWGHVCYPTHWTIIQPPQWKMH